MGIVERGTRPLGILIINQRAGVNLPFPSYNEKA